MAGPLDKLGNLGAAIRIGLFDGHAVGQIVDDDRSVWRSFWAMPATLVLNTVAAAAIAGAVAAATDGAIGTPGGAEGGDGAVSGQSGGGRTMLGWGWPLVAMLAILVLAAEFSRQLGRLDRFPRYVIAYNWAGLFQSTVTIAVIVFGSAAAGSGRIVLFFMAVVAVWSFVYNWYLTKHALAIDGPPAAVLVLSQLVCAFLITRIAAAVFLG